MLLFYPLQCFLLNIKRCTDMFQDRFARVLIKTIWQFNLCVYVCVFVALRWSSCVWTVKRHQWCSELWISPPLSPRRPSLSPAVLMSWSESLRCWTLGSIHWICKDTDSNKRDDFLLLAFTFTWYAYTKFFLNSSDPVSQLWINEIHSTD